MSLVRRAAPLVAGLALVAFVTACGSSAEPSAPGTASPSTTVPATTSPATPALPDPTPVPGSDGVEPPGSATQTDTDWGRIWDRLPTGFPRYPGSVPTETGEGPASGVLSVPVDAATAVTFMQQALETAAYSTDALSGPFEDGSYVLESTGEDLGCKVRTTIAPLGSTTAMTVLYGAACPAP